MYKFAKHTDKELAIIMGQRKKGKRDSHFSRLADLAKWFSSIYRESDLRKKTPIDCINSVQVQPQFIPISILWSIVLFNAYL